MSIEVIGRLPVIDPTQDMDENAQPLPLGCVLALGSEEVTRYVLGEEVGNEIHFHFHPINCKYHAFTLQGIRIRYPDIPWHTDLLARNHMILCPIDSLTFSVSK